MPRHLLFISNLIAAKLELASFILATIISSVIQYVVFNCLDRVADLIPPADCEKPREKRPINSYWLYGLAVWPATMLKIKLNETISRDAISWHTILDSLEINNSVDIIIFNKISNKISLVNFLKFNILSEISYFFVQLS